MVTTLLAFAAVGQVYFATRLLTPTLRTSLQGRVAEALLWVSVAGSAVALAIRLAAS
jgi:hypothetical protein